MQPSPTFLISQRRAAPGMVRCVDQLLVVVLALGAIALRPVGVSAQGQPAASSVFAPDLTRGTNRVTGGITDRSTVSSTRSTVRGVVQLPDGAPALGATVVVLETLEAANTDSAGRFTLTTAYRGLATLVARRVGFRPATSDLLLPTDSTVLFTLVPAPRVLTAMTVVAAGEFTMGTGQTATFNALDVVQTPGAAADVARAIQTLPGAQAVDEGSGLFVRGGDVTETRVLIDDAWLLSPPRFDNPLGHVTATVDPFLLDRAVFSSGGFGAAQGNALSGVIRLETAGRPAQTTGTVTASIGSVGAAVALAPHRRLGFRASANANSLQPLVAVFGQAQPYDPPPIGSDLSGTGEWATSKAGRVRAFGVRQASRFGVGNAGVANGTNYSQQSDQYFSVLSWRDSSTRWRPAVTVARSGFDRQEAFTGTALSTHLAVMHLVSSLGVRFDNGWRFAAGGEVERLDARYGGSSVPVATTADGASVLFDQQVITQRVGGFGEVGWQSAAGVRVTAGLRTDRASITAQRTFDPRLSVAWQRGSLGLTAAWGQYHQVAEPVFYRPEFDGAGFAPMRVMQSVVGLQWGSDSTGLRVELYDKQYDNLWQFTRGYGVQGAGQGVARGADLFLRWQLGAGTRSRVAWSLVDSRRTDPHTGLDAPALGDVRHSVSWITQRTYGQLTIGSALRFATGRPLTDVVGVQAGEPQFGAPNALRMPNYRRSDISVSWYRPINGERAFVLWGDLSNVFNHGNVMRYRWGADYRERLPVQAPFNRSLYAGATFLY